MKKGKPLNRTTPLKRSGFKKTSKKRKSLAVPQEIYQAVLARDNGCRAFRLVPVPCGGRIDPHHVIMRSQGGQDTVDNLISLCRVHHGWVHEHPAESYKMGFLKHGWESQS